MTEHSKNSKVKLKKIITTILLLLFLGMFLFALYNIIVWFQNNAENDALKKQISDYIVVQNTQNNATEEVTEPQYKIDFTSLKQKNNDVVAFLKVKGTNIDYIVVQAEDNNYYLTHNLEKNYNGAGWIFMDYRNRLNGKDKNIIIYGHNMQNGSMFGSLKDVIKKEWYTNQENQTITFVTEKENCIYQVFSVYQIEKEDYYITTDFTENKFQNFLDTVKRRSIYNFQTEVKESDQILTLSTCANNNQYRVVLHAKKINPNG